MSNVIALIATIPSRKRSCERLLGELARQTRVPDGVVLVLDGYGSDPAPLCALPVVQENRTANPVGAGNRWLVASTLGADDIIVCLDDDAMLIETSVLVRALVETVEKTDGAAAVMGFCCEGKLSPPGVRSRGELIYAAGCGLAVRAKHLLGLREFADGVRDAGGPDALGLLGDDDALVSAHLWKTGVKVTHAPAGNLTFAPGMRSTSQSAAKTAKRIDPDAQKIAISRITGWPWRGQLKVLRG